MVKDWRIIAYEKKYALSTVSFWRESKEVAIGQKEIHNMTEHIYFLNHMLTKQFRVDLVVLDETPIGMIAYNESEINQLYVHIAYQGLGIGGALLEHAKTHSCGRLRLYTFEVNKKAQQFYEGKGFKKIAFNSDNEEGLPAIEYEWVRCLSRLFS
ncbi:MULTISPECIES: GNAT family N-acetyltransferase [Cytobacillus]|uniref:GNAT family N-acetyltransferase n=1 Tax=Cytobacillus stercorigallinarum TaxID=2762240 RepID=A0ABR8QRS6_9BACI|nr:GNAT family N-acetyltransferase [Cytobacillus stercorigallinarum]MBD7938254.1 GNAT family N-acetyltransferase [Cytobacillus stercorigallinarum]